MMAPPFRKNVRTPFQKYFCCTSILLFCCTRYFVRTSGTTCTRCKLESRVRMIWEEIIHAHHATHHITLQTIKNDVSQTMVDVYSSISCRHAARPSVRFSVVPYMPSCEHLLPSPIHHKPQAESGGLWRPLAGSSSVARAQVNVGPGLLLSLSSEL